MRTKKNSNKGFTIIELLIVLSIAGLILLILLLAIPTLQRNARNNQRNQDVQAILSALSQYELNNSGNYPPNSAAYLQYAKLSFYDKNIDINTTSLGRGVTLANSSTESTVLVRNRQKCDPNIPGASTYVGAGFNDVVALFSIETSNGIVKRCKEL